MTNTWQDIKNANVVIVMGGNAAEAHPCGFKWVIEAKIENGAKLIVVDPRFTRTASVADYYAPIRPGTDIAFLNGVIRYLLEKDAIQHEYVRAYTNASLIVKDDFTFTDGLFSGYNGTPTPTTSRAGTTNWAKTVLPSSTTPGRTRVASSTCSRITCLAIRRRWCLASAVRRRTSTCMCAR